MTSIRNFIISKVETRLYRSCLICDADGLSICDMNEKSDGYKEVIRYALNLIHDLDQKRYKRVKTEIIWIVNTNLIPSFSGEYNRRTKSCLINFDNYTDDQILVSGYYAGIIVHEATHGLLCSRGIRYNKNTRERIERICTCEQNRFYQKMEREYPEYDGLLCQEFDTKNWEYSWDKSKWKDAYQTYKRIIDD